MSSCSCRLHENLPIFNLHKYPGTCEWPRSYKITWLFRGQHELLRKKKKPAHHTWRHRLQLFSFYIFRVSFQKCGSHFQQRRFCPGVFFSCLAPWRMHLQQMPYGWYIPMLSTDQSSFTSEFLCCKLCLSQVCRSVEKLGHRAMRRGRFHLQWHHTPPEPHLKPDPALCSLPPLWQLRLHFRAELKAFSGAINIFASVSKSSKVYVKNYLKQLTTDESK